MNVIYQNIKQRGSFVLLLGLWLVLAMSMATRAQVNLSAGCTTGTADLTGLTAGNQPVNTTLTWHSGTPATTANKLSSITALSPGTYYAAFFDGINNCYSSSTLNVTITAELCLSNVCPATSVNLNTAVSVNNLPASTVLTWHTSLPATTLNKIADPTVVGMSGTYYAAFFDATNNCYSGGGDAATEVIVEILTCAPVVLTNTCPSTTVNLNTAVSVTNTPAGTTLSWHTGTPATTANKINDVTALPAGKYYASFYDGLIDCYSPTNEVTLVVNSCVAVVANPNTVTTTVNTAVNIPVLNNDTNSGVAATLTNVGLPTVSTNPAHGTTSVNADGSINYTPTSGFTGTDTFIYTLCDKVQTTVCDTALVTVSVGCPVLANPTGAVASASSICAGASSTLSANACSSGTLTWYSDATMLTVLPSTTVSPTATSTYYAACVSGTCKSSATPVTVTVNALPTAPVPTSLTKSNVCPSTTADLTSLEPSVVAGITYEWHTVSSNPSASTLVSNSSGVVAGTYYLYAKSASGCYSVASSGVVVTINACILANSNTTTTTLNTAVSIPVLGNDTNNGVAATLTNVSLPTVSTTPAHGTTIVNADGSITYTPATGYVGTDTFVYTLCDKVQTTVCDTALVTVSVGCPVLANPTGAVASASSICAGASSTLSANACSSGTLTWYSDATMLAVLPSTTVSPTATSTYYAACVSGTCKSNASPVTVTVSALPPAPVPTSLTKSNTCPAVTVDLISLQPAAVSGITYEWHTASNNPGAGTLVNTPGSVVAGTYYLYAKNSTGCYSVASTAVTATINACTCPAGTTAPVIAESSLTNTCPTTTVSLAGLTNTGTKPAGTTLVWSTKKVPTSPADTLTSLTGISTGGKYYAMYYHKASNCYSPADSVNVSMTDCESPLPPLPPPSPVCDYSAPANITLTAVTEPAGFLKTYLLVDMANGQIVQTNATAPSFTNVGAGNYYAVAAYYKGTLEDATVGQVITNVSSSEGCLKYSPPLVFRVCGTCDFTTAPATITFTAAPSPTSGATTTYVLIDEYTNKIKAISGTASFAAVDTGYYAVVAVYRTKAVNFVVGDVLYDKVTLLDSCYTTSNSIHYRVCSAPQNNKPIATDDITQTPQDTPVTGNVLPNDFDPDGGVLTVSTTPTTQPTKGQVQLKPDGSYTYTPNPGATGTDKFCYRVCDDGNPSQCDTACVTITIIPALSPGNDKPVATDDNSQTYQDTPVVIVVKANDFDPDGNATLSNPTKLTDPANGTVSFNADGTVTYTPKAGFTGKDSFTYSICDNGTPALCDTATVSVEVLPPTTGNKPPVAVDDANQTTKNTPVSGTVAANDSDPDNNTPLTFSTLGSVVSGLTLNANGTYTYTPATDFVGTVTQKYKVCDSGTPVACDTATLVITVLPPPVAKLLVKVLLQGALYGTSDGLMRDDLRSQNRIPLLEPYTALNATLGTSSTRFKHVIGGS